MCGSGGALVRDADAVTLPGGVDLKTVRMVSPVIVSEAVPSQVR